MVAILAAATLGALLSPQGEDATRLRTLLPNGTTLFVERVPGANTVVAQLVVPSRGHEDTPANHGARHLLEHFLARGPKRDLDRKLEAEGGFLTARTFRDATQFQVEVPAGRWPLALACLRETLQLGEVTAETLAVERKILGQEAALREPSAELSALAWTQAFGESALDPFGTVGGFARVTPDSLLAIHRKMLAAKGTTLLISGAIELATVSEEGKKLLSTLNPSSAEYRERPAGKPGTVTHSGKGMARAAMVQGIRTPSTLAVLAAGLALSSELEDAFLSYTPSIRPGCVVVGQAVPSSDFAEVVEQTDPNTLFVRGRALLKEWLGRQFGSSRDGTVNRALLLAQSPGVRIETLVQEAELLTPSEFAEGCRAYRTGRAVEVRPL